ncbi:LysM domain-containing protein [Alkalihalobacillus sp. LMS6]|uniref:LysM peptidoglycan-binding domain-containing protein n=1 Tax=Alkalihalobacillus sp. LMS6 TaxID=2924034 RepID=UPI0020D10885|nr:LysM peptidoglycan-binding domain-containing protein [Alkalihalobacillus sp. LMS6]UTR07834.1 LysM domain-containing protein [Alkalihalobacillus sp. LMS6]
MRIHIVQKGETVGKLADKYDLSAKQIKQANHTITNPEMLMPGMKVKIPSPTVAVRKEKTVKKEEKPVTSKKEKIQPLKNPKTNASEIQTFDVPKTLEAPPKTEKKYQSEPKPLPPKPPCSSCGSPSNQHMPIQNQSTQPQNNVEHMMNQWNPSQDSMQNTYAPQTESMNGNHYAPMQGMGEMNGNHHAPMQEMGGMNGNHHAPMQGMGGMNGNHHAPMQGMGGMNGNHHAPMQGMGGMNGNQHAPMQGMGGMNGNHHAPMQGMGGMNGNHHAPMQGMGGMNGNQHAPMQGMGGMNGNHHAPMQGMGGMNGNHHAPMQGMGGMNGNHHAPMQGMNNEQEQPTFVKKDGQWNTANTSWFYPQMEQQYQPQPQYENHNGYRQAVPHNQAPQWETMHASPSSYAPYEPKEQLNNYDETDDQES